MKDFLHSLSRPKQFAIGAVLAVTLIAACDRWVVEAIVVPSGSMEPTILRGERLFVARWINWPWASRRLRRFDVVVIDSPRVGHRIIKRIVGLPDFAGQRIPGIGIAHCWKREFSGCLPGVLPIPGAGPDVCRDTPLCRKLRIAFRPAVLSL